jgi:hypothetical protein
VERKLHRTACLGHHYSSIETLSTQQAISSRLAIPTWSPEALSGSDPART